MVSVSGVPEGVLGVFEPTTSSSTGSTVSGMSTGATAAQPSSTKATGQFSVPRTT